MRTALSPDDIASLRQEAAQTARRLHRTLRLPAADLDDLRQDLLVDLIRRLPAFDATRGTLGAFANVVLRHQASRIAIQYHRRQQAQGGFFLSLDVRLGGKSDRLRDTLSEQDGLAAWHGQGADATASAELHHDLDATLARLPAPDRRLCAALAHHTVSTLVAGGFANRSALYRRLAHIRHSLTAYGLGPGWDDFLAA